MKRIRILTKTPFARSVFEINKDRMFTKTGMTADFRQFMIHLIEDAEHGEVNLTISIIPDKEKQS